MLGLFLTILKELMPFLKEALLEGQTFRGWLKNNWLTFAWLVSMSLMVLMIAHLTDMVAVARRNEQLAQQQVQMLQEPLGKLIVRHKELMAENAQLKTTVAELEGTNDQYERWMTNCGVRFEDQGQCKVHVVSPAPKPKPRRPAPHNQPAIPQEKPGFFGRIRDLLHIGRDKDEE